MKEVHVAILKVPDGHTLDDFGMDSKIYGKEVSNLKQIRVNRCKANNAEKLDYTIIMPESMFDSMGADVLKPKVEKIMRDNLKDCEFRFSVCQFDPNDLKKKPDADKDDGSINWLLRNMHFPLDDDDDDNYKDEDDDYDYDDDDDDDDKPGYYQSACWHSSDNAKKMIRRHGVIVANKKDIRKDERIIREFLKEFFPGNAGWKKEFRSDVAKRWLQMFVVTRGQLKRLEKAARKARRENDSGDRVSKALDFTQMLFGTRDHWSDPNR